MPDAMTLAKGLGGGCPIGALVDLRARGAPGCSPPGSTARPSAATRSPRPPASPCSRPSRSDGLLDHAPRGRRAPRRGRRRRSATRSSPGARRGAAAGDRADRTGRRRRSRPRRARPASSSTRWRRTRSGSPRRWSSPPTSSTRSSTALPALLDAPATDRARQGATLMTAVRHFLRDDDLTAAEQRAVLDRAPRPQGRAVLATAARRARRPSPSLFDKPTLRTQVSFAGAHRRARRLPARRRRQPRPDRRARVDRRHRTGARARSPRRSSGAPTGRSGSRRWPRTPACRSSTRSPTTSTRARSSPTCSPCVEHKGALAGPRPSPTSATAPTTWRTPTCSAARSPGMHVRDRHPGRLPAGPGDLARAAELAASTGRLGRS